MMPYDLFAFDLDSYLHARPGNFASRVAGEKAGMVKGPFDRSGMETRFRAHCNARAENATAAAVHEPAIRPTLSHGLCTDDDVVVRIQGPF